MGPLALRATGVCLVAGWLTACNEPEFGMGSEYGFFGGRHLYSYSRAEDWRVGAVYRRLPQSGNFSPGLSELCPKDFIHLTPSTTTSIPENVDYFGPPSAFDDRINIVIPNASLAVSNYVASIRYQASELTRTVLDDQETDRVLRSIRSGCRDAIARRQAENAYVFLMEGMIVAKLIRIAVEYKTTSLGGISFEKTAVNGLVARQITNNTSIHIGQNLVIEIRPKKVPAQK